MRIVKDRQGNQLHPGDQVYRPGEFTPTKVLAIDSYRMRPVQVQMGWHRVNEVLTPATRWYRGDQLEVV